MRTQLDNLVHMVPNGDVITGEHGQVYVKERCEVRKTGNWYCVTHRTTLRDQGAMKAHVRVGEHEIAWNCWEHGMEQGA